jgi:predicted nuclease with TOPRIM domain
MRTTTIILGALLVLSVIANAVLGYTSVSFFVKSNQQELTIAQQKQTLIDTQTKLASTITQYNAVVEELNQATADNGALTKRVGQLEDEATRTTKTLNEYRDRLNTAEYFVSRAQCPVTVEEWKADLAIRNDDIRAELIRVYDAMYSSDYSYSQWIVMWTGSKDAVLQIFTTRNTSVRMIVTWDDEGDDIQSIFDVNMGCVLYARDRGNSW